MRENPEVIYCKEMALKQQLKGSVDFFFWYLAQTCRGRSGCEM